MPLFITRFIYAQSNYRSLLYSKYIQEYYATIYYCITIHLCVTSKRNLTLICKNYTISWHELEFENYQIADHSVQNIFVFLILNSFSLIILFSRTFFPTSPPPPQNA